MPKIPQEALPYFESSIYLPMLIKVLKNDLLTIQASAIKLKRPYTKMIDHAIKDAKYDLKLTNVYLCQNNMKLYKGNMDADFTEYGFNHLGIEDKRRYSNIRLRNRTEELIEEYFSKFIV